MGSLELYSARLPLGIFYYILRFIDEEVKYLAQTRPLCPKWQRQDLLLGYLASSRPWTLNHYTLLKHLNFWFKKIMLDVVILDVYFQGIVSQGVLLELGRSVLPGSSLEIWIIILQPHSRCTEWKSVGWNTAICALTRLQLILIQVQVWETLF